MKKNLFILLVLLGLFGCKSGFEKVRTSNNPEQIFSEANKYYKQGDYFKAQTLYDIILPFYRGKTEAETVFLNYAYCHYYQDQFLLANHYFDNYANTFYASPHREEASFMAAKSYVELSPSSMLDQTYSDKAINAMQKFINTFPDSDRVDEATNVIDGMRQKLEDKAFAQGKLYYDIKNYKAAISSLRNMMKDFPETNKGEEIRWLILDSNHILAENSVFAKKEERFEETLKLATKFIIKYPQSAYINKAQKIKENSISSLKEVRDVRLKESTTAY